MNFKLYLNVDFKLYPNIYQILVLLTNLYLMSHDIVWASFCVQKVFKWNFFHVHCTTVQHASFSTRPKYFDKPLSYSKYSRSSTWIVHIYPKVLIYFANYYTIILDLSVSSLSTYLVFHYFPWADSYYNTSFSSWSPISKYLLPFL